MHNCLARNHHRHHHRKDHADPNPNSRQRYTATDHHKPEKATSHPISQPQPTRNNTRLLQLPAPAARVGLAQKSEAPSAPAKCRTLPPCDARPFPQQCCDRSVVLCTHWTYEPQKCIEQIDADRCGHFHDVACVRRHQRKLHLVHVRGVCFPIKKAPLPSTPKKQSVGRSCL